MLLPKTIKFWVVAQHSVHGEETMFTVQCCASSHFTSTSLCNSLMAVALAGWLMLQKSAAQMRPQIHWSLLEWIFGVIFSILKNSWNPHQAKINSTIVTETLLPFLRLQTSFTAIYPLHYRECTQCTSTSLLKFCMLQIQANTFWIVKNNQWGWLI